MTDYIPIDCGLHSTYELAVMQQHHLALSWRDTTGAQHAETVMPLDLYTRNREEFLRVRSAGGTELAIRLDRITACSVL